MKKISLYILIICAQFLPINMVAQHALPGRLSAEDTRVTRERDNVMISMGIRTDNLDLGSQEMVYVTPILYSADSSQWHQFDPVIIAGGTRYKVLHREMRLHNTKFEKSPQAIVKYHRRKAQTIPLTLNVPYQEWMSNSRLVLHEDLTGCACENEAKNTYLVMTPVLPVQYKPRFEVAYITPPIEENKQRSETYAAHINFEVAKHVVLPNYKNNREVLNQVDKIIREIRDDANVKITGFNITGYASPEGNAQSNMTLSKNRAQAFVLYLIDQYKIVPSQINTDWKGEDWQGLRDVVAKLDIADKQQVLNIIDGESNVATRKAKLQALSGGTTYRMLLRDYYPPLRRNEYTISFTVKGFDLDEAKDMMKNKPQYLSQHEMYLVAQSYPANSVAYNEAFATIAKYFPNDETAVLNKLAADLANGNMNVNAAELERINKPEAWNNLGIMAFEKKEYQKAENYFRRAAQAGLATGISNLKQFDRFKQ